jgi:hypothetical protein
MVEGWHAHVALAGQDFNVGFLAMICVNFAMQPGDLA